MIFSDIRKLAKHLELLREDHGIVATSGGFDPIHLGHIQCLRDSKNRSDEVLIVIANGDGFLTRKKGKVFLPLNERLEILNSLRWVNFVIAWDDGSQNVNGALEILRPHIFTKGGDKSTRESVPEAETCDKLGITLRYGVGGADKIQSSSVLLKGYATTYYHMGPHS